MNRKCVILTILITLSAVGGYTFYKIAKRHNERIVTVTEKRILEQAEECVWEDNCKENRITLKELMEKGYLGKEVNPITKMYYDENSYIEKTENTYTFHEKK